MQLEQIASFLNANLKGDPSCEITGIASLNDAQAGQISFLDNPLYKKYLPTTKASAVILSERFLAECPTHAIVVENPYVAYAKLTSLFLKINQPPAGIHASAVIGERVNMDSSVSVAANVVIGENVTIGKNVIIGAACVIGDNVEIQENTRLWPHVVIYHDCRIGKRTAIHSGAVIGSDGFGLARSGESWVKIHQLGAVVIGDDVEIGANTCIDRGALADTRIENGVKIDNLVQVGHNVVIGENTAIAGCVAIAGSSKIGKSCMIGGKSAINGHIEIADKVVITGMTSVSKSISEPGGIYSSGILMQTNAEWRKNAARFRHLDELAKRIEKLEKQHKTINGEEDLS